MRLSSWQEKIEAAASEREVVDVVRDYLASHHYAVARLPDDCKPTRMIDGADISACTLALVRRHVVCVDLRDDFAHLMTAFFVLANTKVTRLLATSNDGNGALRDTA